jgi:hypothetical protein
LNPETKIEDAPAIESTLIREFQRWYDGENQQDVRDYTIYCMSVMQHYGAPTRLLDWTYSPYVALYFAIEKAYDKYDRDKNGNHPFALWCLDSNWCYKSLASLLRKEERIPLADLIISRRGDDVRKKDDVFKSVYMPKGDRIKCALPENPFYFHKRLYAQQSIVLCPGDFQFLLKRI